MIHPQDDFRAARSMLKELLQEYGDPPIKDYDKLTVQEKTFLAGTCASTVMLFTICYIAQFNEEEALKGLAAMHANAEKQIKSICDGTGLGRYG